MIGGDYIKYVIYCNNERCPFKDCDRRIDKLRSAKKREEATKIDMQCICDRYTKYLADQINQCAKSSSMNK